MRVTRFQVSAVTLLFSTVMIHGCGGEHGESRNNDPLQSLQWYLSGDASRPEIVHINLPKDEQFTGRGVLVSIIDNGMDLDHEDLSRNISYGNFSYLPEQYGFSDANHGTAVAGLIAAEWGNGVGGRGVAPDAQIVSFNAVRTPAIEHLADALQRDLDRVSVSNNSWGDFNSWGEPLALRSNVEQALIKGTTQGRQGKGTVYVFSAGNGATIDGNGIPSDNVNYSGLVNNYYTLPICAVDAYGRKTSYSEMGASLLVCAPSRGADSNFGVFTTDVTGKLGYNNSTSNSDLENKNYTRLFGGTSAAAPLVSGVVALMLEANPDLGWRDVRYILAKSAKKNDPTHSDWHINGAGLHINHSYGFGLVDAQAAIRFAHNWETLPTPVVATYHKAVGKFIPDNDYNGISDEIEILDNFNVEFVDIFFDAPDHPRLGDLEISLISPMGTKSILAERHNQTFETFRYRNWRFGSLRHLGEPARGRWRLEVRDKNRDSSGSWQTWTLQVHGYPGRGNGFFISTNNAN
jgi:subtilisin-like proprotein convertase family protein